MPEKNTSDYKLFGHLVKETKPRKISLTGYSMFPFLIHGDMVSLDYDKSKISDGDIVVSLDESGIPRIHRYLRIPDRTKGDSSIYFDTGKPEPVSRIVGVSKGKLHYYKSMKYGFFNFIPPEIQLATEVLTGDFEKIKNDIYLNDLNYEYLLSWLKENEILQVFISKIDDFSFFPQSFTEALKEEFVARQGAFRIINEAFVYINDFMKSEGIPFVPLKGMDFTCRYYDDPFQRLMYDIDIMVEEKDLKRLIEKMKNNSSFEFRSLDLYLKHHHHFQVLMKDFKNMTIEVHWKLPDLWADYRADFKNDLKNGILCIKSGEMKYSNEMNLCIVSLSAFSHPESFFKQLYDAYLIIRKEEIDWNALKQIASKLKVQKRLRRLLLLMEFFFEGAPPLDCMELIPSKSEKIMIAIIKDFIVNLRKVKRINSFLYRYFLFENFWNYSERFFKNALFKFGRVFGVQ